MSFWAKQRWIDRQDESSRPDSAYRIVKPFNENFLEGANYLLSIGEEVYVSVAGKPSVVHRLSEKETFEIAPGQFAFLLTEEKLSIPLDAIGFISIRSKQAFLGLVNISGFHVDPGYEGKLVFSVFNAGPTRIVLRRGDRIFPLWLSDFSPALNPSKRPKPGYEHIPSEMISSISGAFTSAYEVQTQLDTVKKDVEDLKLLRLYVVAAFGIFVALFFDAIKNRVMDIIS